MCLRIGTFHVVADQFKKKIIIFLQRIHDTAFAVTDDIFTNAAAADSNLAGAISISDY